MLKTHALFIEWYQASKEVGAATLQGGTDVAALVAVSQAKLDAYSASVRANLDEVYELLLLASHERYGGRLRMPTVVLGDVEPTSESDSRPSTATRENRWAFFAQASKNGRS